MPRPEDPRSINLSAEGQVAGGRAARVGDPRATLRLLAFALGSESYALDASTVAGIEPQIEVTPVPGAPPWLLGVFNLRGTILPAVDIRSLLGAPHRSVGGRALFVVFRSGGVHAALSVDDVDEIYEIAESSLEPALPALEGGPATLLRGQVRVRDRLIGVLDVPELLHVLMGEH